MNLVFMSFSQARARLVLSGAALAAVGFMVGCGTNAVPVVTPINTPGPPAQPQSLAAVVSYPGQNLPGIATIIDYSGDTIMAQQPIGVGPMSFSVDSLGANGYTVNSDGTLTNFPISTSLQEKNITYTTLPTNAQPTNLFSPSAGLWAVDQTGNSVDVFTGSPEDFQLAIPVAPVPVELIGLGSIGQRNFAISLNQTNPPPSTPAVPYDITCNTPSNFAGMVANGEVGEADTIEIASHTVSNKIPLGVCPVYGVMSTDGQRLFVLNRGDDTITVINVKNNTLDSCVCPATGCVNQNNETYTCHPTLPLSTTAVTLKGITPPNGTAGMTATAGPVYAEYNAATSQLVVADYDGGTVSIIDVSLDEYGNDTATFGTTFTVPVGLTATPYPASVTVLNDGSRAYTANQGDGAENGTVSIVTLSSHTVEKTLAVFGHPRTVVNTQNSVYGKVYVASPDSPSLTIIRTDQDIVDTTVLVEGYVVDVRVQSQTAANSNTIDVSRSPGAGQPCNLPPSLEPAPTVTQTAMEVCQSIP